MPEYLKEAFGMRKPKYSRSSSNGYIPGTPDFKEKEDMYDEIIELKKCLQAHKSENDVMKTRIRRLEEENSKKEKQIEQLLDPIKGSEYTRSLVDKKNDLSSVYYGLKQKILKLEQQCKEKDTALNKLQSDLKTTNIEELKITVETYYEEVQRLRVLLASAESTEKSNTAENRAHLKQQKVLNAAVLKLSKNVKHLEEENKALREEVRRAMGSPSSTSRGYSDWSKQRLVRRVIELEKKIKDADSGNGTKSTSTNTEVAEADPIPQGAPAHPSEKEARQECARLRGIVKRHREERTNLQKELANRDAEIKRLSAERARAVKDVERAKATERDQARHHFKEEIEKLTEKINILESQLEEERHLTLKSSQHGELNIFQEQSSGGGRREMQTSPASLRDDVHQAAASAQEGRETEDMAANSLQQRRQQHRLEKHKCDFSEEDVILIQSAIRGHVTRQKSLNAKNHECKLSSFKSPQAESSESVDPRHTSDGVPDSAVVLLQCVFRGHLARCSFKATRPTENPAALPALRWDSKSTQKYKSKTHAVRRVVGSDEEEIEEDIPDVSTEEKQGVTESNVYYSSLRRKQGPAQLDLHPAAESARAGDSDDSDDIIISPSRPLRRRDIYF
ncbi:IQ domain-containing protein E isoform X2 [Brienomyrus brachyistius]|uniref:IQ domain-containing protein E isoform X2 n=1 Tax=Brienomyrus brachyistius TaxID=42636 RepID=UPI0020B25850|nr:IQ domain-containing protein E isoform X2 [Brienomyrus brachyistius]